MRLPPWLAGKLEDVFDEFADDEDMSCGDGLHLLMRVIEREGYTLTREKQAMTTAQITGGEVEYTWPSNYAEKQSGAKVRLTFGCAEGCSLADADAMLNTVSRMALNKAREMVGQPVTAVAAAKTAEPAGVTPTADPMANVVPLPQAAPQAEAASIGQASPVSATVDPMAGVSTSPPSEGQPTTASPAADPMATTVAPAAPAASATVSASDASTTKSPSDGIIPDDKLVAAVRAKADKLQTAANGNNQKIATIGPRIKAVLWHFVEPPQQSQQLPQELRAPFLAALEQLALDGPLPVPENAPLWKKA